MFGPEYLVGRPLLRAIEHPGPRPAVLLIDEIDRADDEFEAFLFELLAESSVTIPELGTIQADRAPGRRADLEPHPRPARRTQTPLPLPLDRLSAVGTGGGDRPPAGADEHGRAGGAGRRGRWPGCARSMSRSHPASPRRSTGRSPSTCSGLPSLDAGAADATLGSVLKYREDVDLARERASPGSPATDSTTDDGRDRAIALMATGVDAGHRSIPPLGRSSTSPGWRRRSATCCTAPACRRRPIGRALRRRHAGRAAGDGRRALLGRPGHAGRRTRPPRPVRPGLPPGVPRHRRPCRPPRSERNARRRRHTSPGDALPHRGDASPAAAGGGVPFPVPGESSDGQRAAGEPTVLAAMSSEERLRSTAFADLTPDELIAAPEPDGTPRARRRRSARAGRTVARRTGGAIDLRATLRRARRTAGDPVDVARRARTDRDRAAWSSCATSRDRWSRTPGRTSSCCTARSAARGPRRSCSPPGSPALTRALRATTPTSRSAERALAAPDWSGGTRIGAALQRVHRPARPARHGPGARSSSIVSDGWERDDPADSAVQMARLPAWPTGWSGSTRERSRRVPARSPAAWRRRCRSSTPSSAATHVDALDELLAAIAS